MHDTCGYCISTMCTCNAPPCKQGYSHHASIGPCCLSCRQSPSGPAHARDSYAPLRCRREPVLGGTWFSMCSQACGWLQLLYMAEPLCNCERVPGCLFGCHAVNPCVSWLFCRMLGIQTVRSYLGPLYTR
jgi:hypothetical protein